MYLVSLSQIEVGVDCPYPALRQRILQTCELLSKRKYRTQRKILNGRQAAVALLLHGVHQLSGASTWTLLENDKPVALGLPLSEHGFTEGGSLHGLSYTAMHDVIEAMKYLGLIEIEPGGIVDNQKMPSKVWPTEKFYREHGKPLQWRPRKISKRDPIILKNYDQATKNSYQLSFSDTPAIRAMRKNLRRINQALLDSAIALAVDEFLLWRIRQRISKAKDARMLTFDRVELRRVFARSSFQRGGRFYGGWWQGIPSEFRKHVTINGQDTVEVDFSTLHPLLMYQEHQVEPPPGDFYDVGWEGKDWNTARPIFKKIFNAILNDESGFFQVRKEDLKVLGMTGAEAKQKLFVKHPLLKRVAGKGLGLRYQFIDSQIAERVMIKLLDIGIIALPIHDSFIVAATHQQALVDAMIEAFHLIVGSNPLIKEAVRGSSLIEPSILPSGGLDLTYLRNVHRSSSYHVYHETYYDHQASVSARSV